MRTSEGFCPVHLLCCDECWDQQVELPETETPQTVVQTHISSLRISPSLLIF